MSAQSKKKNAEMAAMMKKAPNRYPDSTMRPCPGNGSDMRKLAHSMGVVPNTGRHYMIGMMGGILAHKMGFKSNNIPAEFLA